MSFAESAFERLNKIAPEIASMVVNFQDMSDELGEDSSVSLGIFTVRSGGVLYFIPIVAKGSNVYPIDSIYSSVEGKFFPLSKSGIEKVKSKFSTEVGTPARVPSTVNRNPSIRELVEPPRTGKYMYAGGRVSEVMAQSSNGLKKAMLEKMAQDRDLTKGLHKMGFDIKEMISSLKPIEKEALEIAPEVKVVTDGENLDSDVVQMILDQGYAIIGEHREPRVAVESGLNNEGLSTIKSAQPHTAYEIVMKDGGTRLGFVPKKLSKTGLGLAPEGNAVAGMHPYRKPHCYERSEETLVILENGDYTTSCEAVISTRPHDYIEVVKNIIDSGSYSDISSLERDSCFVIVAPNGCSGKLEVTDKMTQGETTTLKCMNSGYEQVCVVVTPNIKSDVCVDGNIIYVSDSAKALVLKRNVTEDVEKDINVASKRREMKNAMFVKEAHTLVHDGVEFFYDKKPITKEAALAELLSVREGLAAPVTMNLIKKAKEEGSITFYMSKKAANMGATPAPFPEYGTPAISTDDNMDRARSHKQATVIADSIKKAMGTRDKQVVEATIMSQFINDPDMYETVESYIPDLKEAVDKLGRSIVLFRLKSEVMSDDMETEELSDLMTSLRNTFRTLGDNVIRLENIANNAREQG